VKSIILIEPFLWDDVSDYPDLGVAMVAGACLKNEVKVEVFPTQRYVLRWAFVEEAAGLVDAIRAGNHAASAMCSEWKPVTERIAYWGRKGFVSRLAVLYESLITPGWANFFGESNLTEAVEYLRCVASILEAEVKAEEGWGFYKRLSEWICRRLLEVSPATDAWLGFSIYRFSKLNVAIIKDAKYWLRRTVVMGGAATGHLGKEDIAALHKAACADYLIVGPGEEALQALLSEMSLEREKIPGVCDLSKEDYYAFVPPQPVSSLNDLAFPFFSKEGLRAYAAPRLVLPLQSSRGCPWRKCEFCTHHEGYLGRYQQLAPERFVEIVEYYADAYQCHNIILHDEDVTSRRAILLSKALKKGAIKRDTALSFYARPTGGYAAEGVFNEIKESGFVCVSWGVESGSQRILDALKKGTNIDTIVKVLEKACRGGVGNICWLMVGSPTEQVSDIEETVALVETVGPYVDYWLVSQFVLQKTAKMAGEKDAWGIVAGEVEPLATSMHGVEFFERMPSDVLREKIDDLMEAIDRRKSKVAGSILIAQTNRARLIPFLLRALARRKSEPGGRSLIVIGDVQRVGGSYFLRTKMDHAIMLTKEEARWIEMSADNCVQESCLKEGKATIEKLIGHKAVAIVDGL
jgi:hypothetical protein